jgi:hypothetical protein
MIEPMAQPRIVMLEEGYRLEVDGQSSEEADYGDPIEFQGMVAFVDLDEEGNPCTPLNSLVYKAQEVECEEASEGESADGAEPED